MIKTNAQRKINKYYIVVVLQIKYQTEFVSSDLSWNEKLLLFFQCQVLDASTRICIMYFFRNFQRQRIAH